MRWGWDIRSISDLYLCLYPYLSVYIDIYSLYWREAYNCYIMGTLNTELNVIMLFIRIKYAVKMGLLVSNVSWQERLGNRELYIANFTPKHERQRHQESHQFPHEEEPEFTGTPTEGNVAAASANPPSCLLRSIRENIFNIVWILGK